ncbi:Tn3 family transposase [Clostridium sp.]|uniref:Tn3 family transposase n=1 Tax=Clostridium sp. TaxID=1506 RepID=UPI0032175405
MATIERTAYPRFKRNISAKELIEIYIPSHEEIEVAHKTAKGELQVLNYILLLKSFQRLGYFPRIDEIPIEIVKYLSLQLNITSDIDLVMPNRTLYRYKSSIRKYLNVTEFGATARHVITESTYKAAQVMNNPADLINVAIETLVKERFELPAFSTLNRSISHIRTLVNSNIYENVLKKLTTDKKCQLDNLLNVENSDTYSKFNYLKETPKSATIKHLKALENTYQLLLSMGDVENLIKDIPIAKIKHFSAEAKVLDASEINKFSVAKRYTLILSLIYMSRIKARDNLVEMFLKCLRKIKNKGKEELKKIQEKNRVKTENLISILTSVLEKTNGNEHDDTVLGQQIRELVNENGGIEILLTDCDTISSYNGNNYLHLLWNFYKSYRKSLFILIKLLGIRAASQDQSLIEALNFLLANEDKRTELLPFTLDLDFASVQWQNTVTIKENGNIFLSRRHLEVCIFYYLASGLKTGDLCIDNSEEFADYREQLLPWGECEPLVSDFCAEMDFKEDPSEFVEQLKSLLKEKSMEVDKNYPDNGNIIINEKGGVVLKRAKPNTIPKSSVDLENAIYKCLPERDVIEVLCNVEHWLNWTRHFGPLSGSDPKLDDAVERYVTLAFGYGCNLGATQTSRHMKNSVTPHMLSFTNRRHITANKLDYAIKDIINVYSKCYLPKLWGNDKIAAVDGTMIDLYKENLVSEYHIRYGGNGGIAYHHVSDTYIALFSHFIPCGVWEAIYIIDGLMKNKSDVQPDTIHGDTQSQSAPVFALTYLLGIKLMPRIRNWKDLKFYRVDKTHEYKHIDSLFSDVIDWKLIETHWKDMLQVVLSIKAGKIVPSTLLRKLNNHSHKNKLYQAFRELGRVIRTIFLLQYISDIEMRQQITSTTNKVESYNGFSKYFSFGGEGIISENDPDEQEKRIKYNDLVSNAVILQNVVDMTHILKQLATNGVEFSKSDVASLSPYLTRHIKRFGDYVIDLKNIPNAIDMAVSIPMKQDIAT